MTKFLVGIFDHLDIDSETSVYVELGLGDGLTFMALAPRFNLAIGVDTKINFSVPQASNIHIFNCSTEDFWSKWDEDADYFFVDADHSFESVRRDFENAYRRLRSGGLIFLHDTDPITSNKTKKHICGDAYKIVAYIRNRYPGLQLLNLPVDDCGLTIVRRNELRLKEM